MQTTKIVKLDEVPESDVERVVSDFMSEGASVRKVRTADGTWRIIATFGVDEKTSQFVA